MAELHIGLIITVSDEDDPEDTLEDIQESIGILMLDHPEWQPANVHIAGSPDAGGDAARYREALEYIAHFDDSAMMVARTLHYDMRGKARAALAAEQRPEGGETEQSCTVEGCTVPPGMLH